MNQEWIFKTKEGVEEKVSLERWCWSVLYNDETEFNQFDSKGVFHKIREVDQSKILKWALYQKPMLGAKGAIEIIIPQDKEVSLIHKYKNYVFSAGTPNENKVRVYVFGYKIKGQQAHLNYILPDNTIVQGYGDELPVKIVEKPKQ